jgi:hypothetical protein
MPSQPHMNTAAALATKPTCAKDREIDDLGRSVVSRWG